MTPRPRVNLILFLYHGVLGPRAAWRSLVVQFGTTDGPGSAAEPDVADNAHPVAADRHPRGNYLWADLMRRSMGVDVPGCPRCGGRLRLIALIDDPAVIQRVLHHLGLSTAVPKVRPARAPPQPLPRAAPVTQVASDQILVDRA